MPSGQHMQHMPSYGSANRDSRPGQIHAGGQPVLSQAAIHAQVGAAEPCCLHMLTTLSCASRTGPVPLLCWHLQLLLSSHAPREAIQTSLAVPHAFGSILSRHSCSKLHLLLAIHSLLTS